MPRTRPPATAHVATAHPTAVPTGEAEGAAQARLSARTYSRVHETTPASARSVGRVGSPTLSDLSLGPRGNRRQRRSNAQPGEVRARSLARLLSLDLASPRARSKRDLAVGAGLGSGGDCGERDLRANSTPSRSTCWTFSKRLAALSWSGRRGEERPSPAVSSWAWVGRLS